MALQSSGAISMSEIRSEIGTSGAISMSDLYRVNTSSEFPTEKEITDAISSISYSGVSGATLGYSNRYMYGDLSTYSGGLGAGGIYAYGFLYNGRSSTSSINAETYIFNTGTNGASYTSDCIFEHHGTSKSGQTLTETTTLTMGKAGTYYVWGYSLNLGQLGIEVDTGSGFSTVYSLAQQSTTSTSRYTFNASVGHKLRLTLKGIGEEIIRYVRVSTSSSSDFDKTITVNSGVPSSGAISFSDLYGAEG